MPPAPRPLPAHYRILTLTEARPLFARLALVATPQDAAGELAQDRLLADLFAPMELQDAAIPVSVLAHLAPGGALPLPPATDTHPYWSTTPAHPTKREPVLDLPSALKFWLTYTIRNKHRPQPAPKIPLPPGCQRITPEVAISHPATIAVYQGHPPPAATDPHGQPLRRRYLTLPDALSALRTIGSELPAQAPGLYWQELTLQDITAELDRGQCLKAGRDTFWLQADPRYPTQGYWVILLSGLLHYVATAARAGGTPA